MRICSFLPSATETVYALGLGDSLYGVSHECDYPPEARAKPKVVRSRFDPADYTSQEIDRLVADMVSRGERIYDVDTKVLEHAAPDLIITQELCDVCAISFEDVQRAAARLDPRPELVSLDPTSLADVIADIRRVGLHTGQETRAQELGAKLQERIETVRSTVESRQASPKVACIEWLDPLIVAGHWVPEMVESAGGIDGLAQPAAPARRIEMGELVGYDPDVLILMPCGMDVDRAIHEFGQLDKSGQWSVLSAIQRGRVYAVDAGGLFSRSGPRLVDGLELMAQIIHPELFPGPLPEGAAQRLEAPSTTG